MDFQLAMPSFYTRVKLPYDQVIDSLAFLFHSDRFTGQTHAQMVYKIRPSMASGNGPPPPPHRSGQQKIENRGSALLSREENDLVFGLLGKRCFTLATAVVQLVLSEGPAHSKWNKKVTGVACFVKDHPKRSYFIRVYEIDHQKFLVWQQELYTTFEYKTPRPYFHTFEADSCMAGLSFASEEEASVFQATVDDKLKMRQQKHNERRRGLPPASNGNGTSNQFLTPMGKTARSHSHGNLSNNNNSFGYYEKKPKKAEKENKKKKDKVKPRLTKGDIGTPTNFVHVQHVGWDPTTGFDLDNVSPALREFFKVAGVSDEQLKDTQTRDFIYTFIDQHGGVDNAIASIQAENPPPLPANGPVTNLGHQHGHRVHAQAPPPPPNGIKHHHGPPSVAAPPPPPARHVPMSKPPMAPAAPPPPPPPPSFSPPSGAPPPPPPPPANFPSPPSMAAPVPRGPPLPVVPDARNAFLEQIKAGSKLKHVDAESDSIKSSDSSNGGVGRDALLNQIKSGVQLRPTETNAGRPVSGPGAPVEGGLAGALARALHERSRAIQQTDESSSDSDDDQEEDEWDD